MLDAVANGATDGQALAMGLASGAFEMLFEKYELESLLKNKNGRVWKAVFNQALSEGVGEGSTTLANNLADVMIMAENSGYMQKVRSYRDQGMTEGQAMGQTLTDMAIDLGWDVVGGMLTGGIMGGGAAVGQKISDQLGGSTSSRWWHREENGVYGDWQILVAADAATPSPEGDGIGSAQENEVSNIKAQIRNNQDRLNAMDVVAQITIPKTFWQMSISEKKEYAINKLRSTGFKVNRKGFGLINYEEKRIKKAFNYFAKGSAEEAIFEALPYVLKEGVEISRHADHKERGYGTVTFAAPVSIDGQRGNMAVVVKQTTDNFYKVHRILSPDGSVIDMDLTREEAEPTPAGELPHNGSLATPISSASNTSISDPAVGVNQENASIQGQVLRKGSESPVQVAEITGAGGGKLQVKLADGSSADISELSFPDQGQQELYNTIAKISHNGEAARQLWNAYQSGDVPARDFARGIEEAYLYGKLQFAPQELESKGFRSEKLTPAQRNTAYTIGKMAGEKAAAQRQVQLRKDIYSGKTAKKGAGKLHFDGDRSALTERQKVSLQTCEVVAKALGIDVYVFRSQLGSDGRRIGDNGWYDPKNGSIHIDLHAGMNGEDAMVFTLAHELTHFIKDWSVEKYRSLAGFLAEQYASEGISVRELVLEKQADAEKQHRSLTFEQAHEEWVADSMETMLTDGAIVEKLSLLQAKDEGMLQKIKEFLDQFLQRLKAAYRGLQPRSKEGQIVSRMTDAAEQLHSMFADALIDAGNTFRGAEKNTTGEGGVRFQTRHDGNYADVDLTGNSYVYTWDYLIAAKDMKITYLPEVNAVRNSNGRVDPRMVIALGLDNAKKAGSKSDGKVFVKNNYTGRSLRIDAATIRHGLSGTGNRILTNARLGAVIGDVVTNAIPINALHNKSSGVSGTYAMAAYAKDSQGREFIAIVTIEERNGEVSGIETHDVTHSVSGRQKNSSRADTRSQGVYPSTTAKIKISDFLHIVKSTHQSILSADVLAHIGGEKDESSYYSRQVKFSARSEGSISPREMLLNTVEGMVANSAEWEQLQKYRRKIKELNAAEEKVERLGKELQKLYFPEDGQPRDYEMIQNLQKQRDEAIKLLNRYDSQLISLENTKPIRDIVDRLTKAAFRKGAEKAKTYYREKMDAREQDLRQHYQESRRKAVENHEKAQMRQRIKKEVQDLRKLNERAPKDRRTKEELQEFASSALKAADMVFLENYNEYNMIRNGVGFTLRDNEQQLMVECKDLLSRLDSSEPTQNTWDPGEPLRFAKQEEAIKKELFKKVAILREAGVFEREFKRINQYNASQLIDELLSSYEKLKETESTYLQGAYQEKVYQMLSQVKSDIGAKAATILASHLQSS